MASLEMPDGEVSTITIFPQSMEEAQTFLVEPSRKDFQFQGERRPTLYRTMLPKKPNKR